MYLTVSIHFQCKCNGSKKVKVNQGMGCKKGGYADCPTWHNLYCKDGTNIGNPTESMKWRLTTSEQRRTPGYKGCACADGVMPRWALNHKYQPQNPMMISNSPQVQGDG